MSEVKAFLKTLNNIPDLGNADNCSNFKGDTYYLYKPDTWVYGFDGKHSRLEDEWNYSTFNHPKYDSDSNETSRKLYADMVKK